MELTDPARPGRPGNSMDSSVCLPNIGVTDLRCAQLYVWVPGTRTSTPMLVYQALYCWTQLPRQRGGSIRHNRLFVSLSFHSAASRAGQVRIMSLMLQMGTLGTGWMEIVLGAPKLASYNRQSQARPLVPGPHPFIWTPFLFFLPGANADGYFAVSVKRHWEKKTHHSPGGPGIHTGNWEIRIQPVVAWRGCLLFLSQACE